MDMCQICNFFPAIGVCPICQRYYCPDDVQQQQPFLLCIDCADKLPNYLQTGGYWQDNNHWFDNRTGWVYTSVNIEKSTPFKDTREIWAWLEALLFEGGMDLWKIAEEHFQKLNSKENVAISRMRKLGCFQISEAYELATKNLEEGNLDKAHEILDLILCLDSADLNANLLRGDIFRKEGKHKKAIEAYTHVIKFSPKEPYGYYRRAMVNLFDIGNDNDGLEDFKAIEQLGYSNPQLLFAIGIIFARRLIIFGNKNATKPALNYLTQALTMNNEMLEIFSIRGYVYLMSGNDEAAFDDFLIAANYCDYDFFDISMYI